MGVSFLEFFSIGNRRVQGLAAGMDALARGLAAETSPERERAGGMPMMNPHSLTVGARVFL